jgi:uncharacterized membrane protein
MSSVMRSVIGMPRIVRGPVGSPCGSPARRSVSPVTVDDREFVRARTRVLVAFGVAVVVGVALSPVSPWQVAVLAGWSAGAATFVGSVLKRVWPMSGSETAEHATVEDESRALADGVILSAAVASLAAIGLALVKASKAEGLGKAAIIGVAVLAVVAAWLSVHTVYALRYAHLYFVEGGGVVFNTEDDPPPVPDYHDFAYLALTVGMTFQVSDTNISSRAIRRTITRHALVSYLLGAVVVAMAINVVSGLLNR